MSIEVQLAEALRENKDLSRQIADLQVKHTAAITTNGTLQQQVNGIKALQDRIAALEPLEKQTADLQTKARALEAARAYDKMAEELGIKPEFRDAVYKLADFKAEGDEIDPKAVKEHFAKYLEGEGKAFKAVDPKEPSKLAKGEGSSRGAKDPGFGDGDAGKTKVTQEQLNDSDWTKANREMLSDRSKYELVMS